MEKQLHLYTIMPLDASHIDEICEDIRCQYENGVATCALFSMTLVPEGNPPVNKAEMLCKKYIAFKSKLDSMNIPSGVLVQASIGHGWVLGEKFPYQNLINFNNGASVNTVCPYDEGFRKYIYDAFCTIAKCSPGVIMVDDDLRTIFRPGEGCACPLHMKRFSELSEKTLSREELWASVCEDSEKGREDARIMTETQKESVVGVAKIMRKAIDSIDPSIPGLFCCVGSNAEFGYEIAQVLAGEGNPMVVRINNGYYTAPGSRNFSGVFFRAATQIAKLYGKADVILAETDTCPQNRYSTSAISLHAHFTGTILEGASGAKHWITRLFAYEPESGKAYRKILGKYRGFYEELSRLYPSLSWRGCRIPVFSEPDYSYGSRKNLTNEHSAWSLCVLERLGLPQYFSHITGGITCLEGDIDRNLSDEDVMKILSGACFVASNTAEKLISRGFGKYLGVDVRVWNGKQPTHELYGTNGQRSKVQNCIKELVPLSDGVEISSVVTHSVDKEKYEELFPGVAVYKNSLGGTVVTFSGTPEAKFTLSEAFSFLNYSRKKQLVSLMQQLGELPIYFPGDEEVYLKAADMPDGTLFCAVFNLGLDIIEKLSLVCDRKISRIEMLTSDGKRKEISFSANGGEYMIDCECRTLDPVILFLSE